MRARSRGLLAALLTGLLSGGLVACTGGGNPDPPPTPVPPSTSVSLTPTLTPSQTGPLTTGPGVRPGEKPPVMNSLAKQHSRIGALEFAIYYIKALDWSYATSDPYLLKRVSASSCTSCGTIIEGLSKLMQTSGHVVGDRLTVDSTELQSFIGKVRSDYIVEVGMTQQPGAIIDSAGRMTSPNGLTHVTSYVYVSWLDGRWQVVGAFGP